MSREQDLWTEIDSACQEKARERREALLEVIARRLREVVSENETGEMLYALGYVLYNHPHRMDSPALQEETEAVLTRALARNPEHALAKMYLGYNAYDLGRYDVAKERFHGADARRLPPNFALSRDEMILSSDIRTRGLAECLDELESFVAEAERAESIDVHPPSLARTLEELRPAVLQLAPAEYERLLSLARRLDRAGEWTDWFERIVRRR